MTFSDAPTKKVRSNTRERMISAIILVALLSLTLVAGQKISIGVLGVIGALTLHEILVNFIKRRSDSSVYWLNQILYSVSYIAINVFFHDALIISIFLLLAVVGNLFWAYYLFVVPVDSIFLKNIFQRFKLFPGIMVLLPMLSISHLMHRPGWLLLLITLFIINFGMDTGAWMFGKKFGKHKLAPAISPKKTVEGLIGGLIAAPLVGYFFWQKFLWPVPWTFFALFPFFAAVSHLGDLIQSKIKRQYGLKDSSALIPGHGGVYDRIDGLMYLGPFYVFAIEVLL